MRRLRWFFPLLALLACGGKALTDSERAGSAGQGASAGQPANEAGSVGTSGAPAGGANTSAGSAAIGGFTAESGSTSVAGSAAGSAGAQDDSCSVPSTATPARFQFESKRTVWVRASSNCGVDFQLILECGGHELLLPTQTQCTQTCDQDLSVCNTCGTCTYVETPVGTIASNWDGLMYAEANDPTTGCTCYTRRPAPAGEYRVTVGIFTTEQDMRSGTNQRTVTATFHLPADDTGGVVHVDLDSAGL